MKTNTYPFKRFITLILNALLLAGCGQDSMAPRFTGQYTSEPIGTIQPARMYTAHGEVTDEMVILQFLKRKNATSIFNLTESIFQVPTNYVTLDLKADKSALVTHPPSVPYKATLIGSTANELLIAQKDSVQIFVPSSRTRCDELSLKARAHMPAGNFFVPPPFTGYNSGYRFRPQFVVQVKDNQLFLPFLTFIISNTINGASCRTWNANIWDTFNSTLLPQLQHGDTLVYQLKEVKLVRK